MEAHVLNPDVPGTTWSDLRRDEERLRAGRRVLALLRAMAAGSPREPSIVELNEAIVQDVLAGLTSPVDASLVTALLRFDRSGAIPEDRSGAIPEALGPLDALIAELDETLYYEGRLLAAEQ